MNLDEIGFSVRKTKRLVKEYLNIIEEYKEKNYFLDRMVNYEAKIETSLDKILNNSSHIYFICSHSSF